MTYVEGAGSTTKGNDETLIYVIDDNFRIVYTNDELKSIAPEVKQGQFCYEVVCNESSPCKRCPLRDENHGESMIFNSLRHEWRSEKAVPVEWPGAGSCNMIISERAEGNGKKFFYNAVSNSDYDELLELNYLKDSYRVIYHGERKDVSRNRKGKISTMVRQLAESMVHPEDRERFCEFWLLDRIGTAYVPEEMLTTRHGEFRRRRPDGSYEWIQKIFMPARQDTEHSVIVMSFYNIIGDQSHWENAFLNAAEEMTSHRFYKKKYFFRNVEEFLANAPDDTTWCMVSVDIDNLKLFNEWYGRKAGNELIAGVSDCLKNQQEDPYTIVGYFDDDDFALLMPYDEKKIEQLYQTTSEFLESYNSQAGLLLVFGVYEITDIQESVFTMYDRAQLACASLKGNYIERIKKFDPEMLETLETEYTLFAEVQKALEDNEFSFFLQPKYNLENGRVIGAEALARWISKERGVLVPEIFIPFLEKTGLIAELDPHIWEAVCKWQRYMIDSGRKTVPVSVNVSRVDLYSLDVAAYFRELIRKYDLDPGVIEIEITESVYAEANELVSDVIEELRGAGFRVIMDNFSSSYASIDRLKDTEVDILKIDMNFWNIEEDGTGRGTGILEAVVNMGRLLDIGIIAGRVETAAQKKFLQRMGIGYGQGCVFCSPLSRQDFEKLIEHGDNLDTEGFRCRKIDQIYWNDLLREEIFSEAMINNMLGAVAFYDVCENQVMVERYNEHYASLLGYTMFYPDMEIDVRKHFQGKEYQKLFRLFENARGRRHDGAVGDVFGYKPDGTCVAAFADLLLREKGGHGIYYGSAREVDRRKYEPVYSDEIRSGSDSNEEHFLAGNVMRYMPCGVFQYKADDSQEFVYVSDSMIAMLGYSRQEFARKFGNRFSNMVYVEDRESVQQEIQRQLEQNNYDSCQYRIEKADGSLKWVYDCGRLVEDSDGNRYFYVAVMDSDYLNEKYREQQWRQMKYKTLAEIPGMVVFDYEPYVDRLTVEVSSENGSIETIVTEKYLENVDQHDLLAGKRSGQQRINFRAAMHRPTSGTMEIRGRFTKNGEFQWYRVYYKSLADEYGKVYRLVGRADNIEEEMRSISTWKDRAMRDSMTGLLNNGAVKQIVGNAIRQYAGGTLFLMDVDDFKKINDTLGHLKGDELLKKVAAIIGSTFRKEDVLARYGGDEFLMYIPGEYSEEVAEAKAKELCRQMNSIVLTEIMNVKCSIGIAISRSDSITVAELIHQADTALYQAKWRGKNGYVLSALPESTL